MQQMQTTTLMMTSMMLLLMYACWNHFDCDDDGIYHLLRHGW
jgi:hypothetical protein